MKETNRTTALLLGLALLLPHLPVASAPAHAKPRADAVVTEAIEHYRAGDWPRFFAYALYHRVHATNGAGSPDLRLLSLEVIAYLRKCQVDRAEELLRLIPGSSSAPVRAKERLGALIELARRNPLLQNAPGAAADGGKRLLRWKIDPALVLRLDSPKRLSMAIEDACEQGGAT